MISQNLNQKQMEAVKNQNGPLLIIAGAGSGKTKTLTSRLAKLLQNGVNPEKIIAITFTNKAAKEMRERIFPSMDNPDFIKDSRQDRSESIADKRTAGQIPFIGTFHSLGARILKAEANLSKRTAAFTIFDEDDALSLIKKIIKNSDLTNPPNPFAIRAEISKVKNELLDSQEYLNEVSLSIFKKYEQALLKNNAFDFDDLIEKVVRIFREYSKILKKYQDRFQYILVDEFQDVNTGQYQFIKLLAAEHKNLSVVGDDQQSIYGFRGSDFRNFLNFENDWPSAKVVKLEQNYRSTANIITAASELIKHNKFQRPKTLWTENPNGSLIKIIAASNPEEEAVFIAKAAKQPITENLKLEAIAVLYRTNAQSRAIEQALIEHQIPYKLFGGIKFYERKEIKDIVAGLRFGLNPKDEISAERLIKNFPKNISSDLLKNLPRLSQELSASELINFFIVNTNYLDYLERNFKNYHERIENIKELLTFSANFKSLADFLEQISLLQTADTPKNTLYPSAEGGSASGGKPYAINPINLMTIHLAKGLEFDSVFIAGCNEGLLPHQLSYRSQDELEEERRLMYVAMTRAKKNLRLSFSNTPSRFLREIPTGLTEFINLRGSQDELPDEDERYIEYG